MGIFTKSVKDTVDSKFDPNTLKPVAVEDAAVGTVPYCEWTEANKPKEKEQFGFSQLSGDAFKLRGQKYLSDKKKYAGGEPLMKMLAMDWFKDDERTSHVAGRKDSTCQKLLSRPDVDFVFCIVIQFPSHKHFSMAAYFAAPPMDEGSLLHRFVHGEDGFRNERIKLLPRVMEGCWVVQKAVGTVPVLLGKATKLEYFKGPGYFEMDVNTGASSAAHTAIKCVFGYAKHVVVDIAWVIEGRTEAELPEMLLGGYRLAYPDFETEATPPPPAVYASNQAPMETSGPGTSS